MVDTSQTKVVGAKRVPQNIIIPKKTRDKWDTQFNGMIMDLDIISSQTSVTHNNILSLSRWNFVRDLIIIVLLLLCTSVVVWRAILVEKRLDTCASRGEVSVMTKKAS